MGLSKMVEVTVVDKLVEKIKENKIMALAYVSLAVSILSAFTTIVGYTNANGEHRNFSLVDFLSPNGNGFDAFVSHEYIGKVYWDIDISIIHVFVVIGIMAFICAAVGLSIISRQKENTLSFALTILGLVGTMAPSVLILICIVALRGDYEGTIHCGIYPIVSPIAMLVCIFATMQTHRRNVEFKRKLDDAMAKGLISRAGDL